MRQRTSHLRIYRGIDRCTRDTGGLSYSTDLTDVQWARIAPFFAQPYSDDEKDQPPLNAHADVQPPWRAHDVLSVQFRVAHGAASLRRRRVHGRPADRRR